jgi:hypothetical protein
VIKHNLTTNLFKEQYPEEFAQIVSFVAEVNKLYQEFLTVKLEEDAENCQLRLVVYAQGVEHAYIEVAEHSADIADDNPEEYTIKISLDTLFDLDDDYDRDILRDILAECIEKHKEKKLTAAVKKLEKVFSSNIVFQVENKIANRMRRTIEKQLTLIANKVKG